MDINVVVGGLLLATLGYFMAYAFFNADKPPPSLLPWVPIDVRKSKVYVSQTRDAGMFIERSRRLAVLKNKEGRFSYKGSDNGYLDSLLTGIGFLPAPFVPPPPENVIWDGGNAYSEVPEVVDGGTAEDEYDVVDLGNAATNVCDV